MPMPPDSPLVMLAKSLERFPAYVVSYLAGMLVGVTSDIVTTSLAIGSVLIGVIATVWWGLAVFFLGMALIGLVHTVVGAMSYRPKPSYDPVMPPVSPPA